MLATLQSAAKRKAEAEPGGPRPRGAPPQAQASTSRRSPTSRAPPFTTPVTTPVRGPPSPSAVAFEDLTSDSSDVEEIPVELRATARRGVKPTSEQMAVVDAAKAPGDVPLRGEIVRVTAAAGTGKTTTMELVAKRLLDIGHAGVVYMVFNKAAQLEAQRRLPGGVRCRTLNAVALSLVGANGMPLKGDDDAQRYVLSAFGRDIDRFLRDVPREHMTFNLRNYIAMCIWKTLVRFMQSKDDEASGFDPAESMNKTWYPAVKYHLGTLVIGKKEKKLAPGVPGKESMSSVRRFYCSTASRLWRSMRVDLTTGRSECGFWTYAGVVKQAQVDCAIVPRASAILVDEAQDLNACQLSWIEMQAASGKQVFVVGDSAQTIYSFRGAKSEYLRKIPVARERDLTLQQTFRFGPAIAAAANAVLFGKAHSPQVKTFVPYDVFGVPNKPGAVRTYGNDVVAAIESFSKEKARKSSVTLIAYRNAALIVAALRLLAARPNAKIAVYGGAGGSGNKARKWKKACSEMEFVCKMFSDPETAFEVPFKDFKDDQGSPRRLTYEQFVDVVVEEEKNAYTMHVSLVATFGGETMEMVSRFEEQVLQAEVKEENAELVLATVHSAKGAEWPNVVVLDDLQGALARFSIDRRTGLGQFEWKDWGDDFNLWYVACTRAMTNLAVPVAFADVQHAFRAAKDIVEGRVREEYRHRDRFLIPPNAPPKPENAFTKREVVLLDELGKRYAESSVKPGLAPLVLIPIGDPDEVEIVHHDNGGGGEVIDLT